jgi:hypothetical protein
VTTTTYPNLYETPPCIVCNKTTTVVLDADAVKRWKGGELIQSVFPDLDAAAREVLISGTHPECWDELFGEEE